jgi:hypothetical protein
MTIIKKRNKMNKIKDLFSTLHDRWKAKTPLIFSRIIKLAMAISTIAIAIQTALVTAGADIPEWWSAIFPYFVGAGAGMAAVAKLTQQYDRNGNPVKTNKRKKQ